MVGRRYVQFIALHGLQLETLKMFSFLLSSLGTSEISIGEYLSSESLQFSQYALGKFETPRVTLSHKQSQSFLFLLQEHSLEKLSRLSMCLILISSML